MTIIDHVFRDIESREPFASEADIVRVCQGSFDRIAAIMMVAHDDLRVVVRDHPSGTSVRVLELSYFDRTLKYTLTNQTLVTIKEKGKRRPKSIGDGADYSFYNEFGQQ